MFISNNNEAPEVKKKYIIYVETNKHIMSLLLYELTKTKLNHIHREMTQAAPEEEDAHWQVGLKHVEVEEQKSPSPELKPKPESPEVERLEYHPAPKRDRPEVWLFLFCGFHN